MTLLSGARNAKNSVLSQAIYDHKKKIVLNSTVELASAAVLFANTYGLSGDIETASKVKRKMIQSGRKKTISVSWTIINNQIFVQLRLKQLLT